MELKVFLLILIIFGIVEIRAMKKAKLKKEIVTYLIFMTLAGALGIYYLSDPYQKSFSYLIIKLFNLKGY